MTRETEQACNEFAEDLLLYESRELEPGRLRRLEVHLEGCHRCAAVVRENVEVLEAYAVVPEDDLEDRRWREMAGLATDARNARRSGWKRTAAAVVLFLGGLIVGGAAVELSSLGRDREVAALARRVDALEGTLLVSTLRPASSSERLEALTAIDSRTDLSPEAWTELLRVLDTDPSPNVRLAAVDALRRLETIDPVEAVLGELLLRQDSEIIAGALIELVVERRVPGVRSALEHHANGRSRRLQELAGWALAQERGTA